MITTPGELHVGMSFTVLEGKPLVEENWEAREEKFTGLLWFTGGSRSEDDQRVPGNGRVYVVRALQLPMVLAIDLVKRTPVVFDSRKLVFRELDKKYVTEYVKLFARQRRKIKAAQ